MSSSIFEVEIGSNADVGSSINKIELMQEHGQYITVVVDLRKFKADFLVCL
jgi:hypothetical protein